MLRNEIIMSLDHYVLRFTFYALIVQILWSNESFDRINSFVKTFHYHH
jgi:hypothetical protein